MKKVTQCLSALMLLGIAQFSNAQVLSYVDCRVDDPPSLIAAIDNFYEQMEGGPRPVIFLDEWLWNGAYESTHRIIIVYEDFDAMWAFRGRAMQAPVTLATFNSLEAVSDCVGEGVALQRGTWGNTEAPLQFGAVYGISASDGAAYAEAFETLAANQVDTAPGATFFFENRAGYSDSHIVVVSASSLSELNTYLDSLFASDDFAEFQDDVEDIRTVTSRSQALRLRIWAPPAQ